MTTTVVSDWRDLALCRQVDPELFFPSNPEQTAQAKSVCRGCPVTDECLSWALASRIPDGVWGGMSEEERAEHLTAGRRTRVCQVCRDRFRPRNHHQVRCRVCSAPDRRPGDTGVLRVPCPVCAKSVGFNGSVLTSHLTVGGQCPGTGMVPDES